MLIPLPVTELMKPPETYRRARRYMMLLFVWTSAMAEAVVMPLAAAPTPTKKTFPGITDDDILFQVNMGPIVQLLLTVVALKVLSGRHGLSRSIRLGAGFSAGSAFLRLMLVLAPAAMRNGVS